MINKIFALLAISILAIVLVSGCIGNGVPEVPELGGNDSGGINQNTDADLGPVDDGGINTAGDLGPVADADLGDVEGEPLGPVADDGVNYTGSDPGPVAGEE